MSTPPISAETELETETAQHDLDGVVLEHDEAINDDGTYGSDLNQPDVVSVPIEEELLGREHRQKKKSTRIKDFVANTIHMTSCCPIEIFFSCD